MNATVRGFQTEQGIAKYDYTSLENIPDIVDKQFFNEELQKKSDKNYVDQQLALKADNEEIQNALKQKADAVDIGQQLNSKVEREYVEKNFIPIVNKTNIISEESNNSEVPTAKAVYNYIQEQLINYEF